ncbi:phenylacetate--CoA ligase family protein [Paucihalobacter sp.]|uniref:phenylacetate--CoA ligase family protein n=1 Tax=Paucihalobacter sp. TaxID=2850405 RepID=UPI002FE1F10B
MKLFDLTLQLKGFPIKKARRYLQSINAKTEDDFGDFLNQQKQDILDFHLKNNQFYIQFTNGKNNFDHWEDIPVMTKSDLQQPLQNRLSTGHKSVNSYINKTSGSSGDPFIFAKDKFCHALTWAVIQQRFSWYDIDFNSSKQARFYGIPLDFAGFTKEKIKDALSGRQRFSVFDLSDEAFTKHLKKFRTTSFDYINGYTSAIVQFAKFLERGKFHLKTICPTLKACVVTSEMLFEDDKKLMEKVFGVPVINEYGASELDLIAFENPNRQWQINSETLYVEILDENDNLLPNGQEGRIVITSLFNKAHPFIRYDIGDIGILSEDGSLKKPTLKKLIGRTNDIAVLPSGKKAAGLTFYYITKSIIEDDGNIKEFVIEQLKIDTFKITYTCRQPLEAAQEEKIKIEMERYLEPGLVILFEQTSNLNRSSRGKLKQFSSQLKTTL